MAITIEIKKNSGSWVDYSAYIRPGVIREDVEEELTAFRCGDVTCQFQNFAGTFITAVGTGLFDGWAADDVFYIRIKRDSEYHFGGIINYESLDYNAKTKLGEFTAFSYLKNLENYSAETVQRVEQTYTLAAAASEGDEFIEVNEAISELYRDDILLIDTFDIIGYGTEERTVKYVDTSNKKIYFKEALENNYSADNGFAVLKTRQYREQTVSFLATELAEAAGYTLLNFIKDIPTEIETEHLNCDTSHADGVPGFVKSMVGSATGESQHVVTAGGRYEGEFGGLSAFTQMDTGTSKEVDFINDGYLPPTSFTKRFREQTNHLYWFAYAYDRDKKWYLTGHGTGTITVKSMDWNNGSQAWENEQTVGTFSGEAAISPAYDRKNGFVYVGQGASPNTDRLYYVRVSDNSIQYFSGLSFYNNFRCLYFADTLLSISKPAGKARRFRYTGGAMTYLGEADFPKAAEVDTLLCVTDAAHTEFNKTMCLCKATDGDLSAVYLWYCDHDMTNQTYEFVMEGVDIHAMTYEDGALYLSVSDQHQAFYYRISKTRELWIRDANFSNMTVAEALANLAIVARAVFKTSHANKLYFHDRVRYIDSVATDITSSITEKHTKNWKNRIDGVSVKWCKGTETYPSWAKGEIVSIDCELIDTASFAQAVAYYYYRILNAMRKMCTVEMRLADLELLNWVAITTEDWIIYGLEKDLIEEKMKLTLREKFVEAVS